MADERVSYGRGLQTRKGGGRNACRDASLGPACKHTRTRVLHILVTAGGPEGTPPLQYFRFLTPSPLKRTRPKLGQGRGKFKMSLEHSLVPKNKHIQKEGWVLVKRTEKPAGKSPAGQI